MNHSHTLELDSLTIGYTGGKKQTSVVFPSLSGILEGGTLTCLLGSNGVGKSTLLRTLASFQPPLGGKMLIDGVSIAELSARRLATQIAVVLTVKPAADRLTVRQVVALGRSPYTGFWGNCTEVDWQVVDEAMRLTGIAPLAERNSGTLSDGERQKMMIAKALAQQTPIILLDEPTAFLDYPAKVETLLLLRRIAHEQGKIIFLSTHDVELALQLSDRLWLMEREAPMLCGSPRQLAADGSLSRFYRHDFLHFDASTLRFEIPSSDTSVS